MGEDVHKIDLYYYTTEHAFNMRPNGSDHMLGS